MAMSKMKPAMNVKIRVGSYNSGTFCARYEEEFSNTGTQFLTDNIVRFIAGDENTYRKGSGRPNYLGFGTRGIVYQGNLNPRSQDNPNPEVLEEYFDDPNPPDFFRTRPWYNSDSLGGTTFGSTNLGFFWDPNRGWGSNINPDEPTFQGELCTRYGTEESDVVPRAPILSTEVNSDCPNDADYGEEGYKSTVVFRGASTAIWLERLLYPKQGPVLDQIAVSEIGLYEKSNTDPHGLRTLLAGFRVPSDSIIYLQKDEVILVEWAITIQAIMPNEQTKTIIDRKASGISIEAELAEANQIQFTGTVLGENNPRQTIWWSMDRAQSSGTTIDSHGVLTISPDETTDYIQITGVTQENRSVLGRSAVVSQVKNNYPFGLTAYGVPINYQTIDYLGIVIGKGNFSEEVEWEVTGQTEADTAISSEGRLNIDLGERASQLTVVATSVVDSTVSGSSKVTLATRVLDFYPIPAGEPCLAETTVATLSVHASRDESVALARIDMRLVPIETCTVQITLADQNRVLAGFTREITGSSSHDIVIVTPISVTSAEHQLRIDVQGNVTVPTINSILYGAFIEEYLP